MSERSAPPLVSVVIPTYQRRATIGRSVHSVLSQQGADFELVVADDGSDDGTVAELAALGDPRLRVLALSHAGRSATRNTGAQQASGELLVFLDSDDEALPGWLEALSKPFGDPAVGLVCAGVRVDFARPGLGERRQIVRLPRDLGPVYCGQRGLFLPGSFMVRRREFLDVGGYHEGLAFAENSELSLRLIPLLLDRGLGIVNLASAHILMHNRRTAGSASGHSDRLHAAKTILALHGDRYRGVPSSYANYFAIAGVNASRLGRNREAIRWLTGAVRWCPWRLRHWLRLLLSLVPPLARRWWARHPEAA